MTALMAPTAARDGAPGPSSRGPGRRPARWRLLVCIAIVVAALGWIAARGLTGSFVYYLTPTDVRIDHLAQVDQRVRLGGYVVPGALHRRGGTPPPLGAPRGDPEGAPTTRPRSPKFPG